ncbi:MAG TPA: ABC transporter substrate-binding protein [bacterium]|nr:ABC transporter substrate-binding protein [bacterium]
MPRAASKARDMADLGSWPWAQYYIRPSQSPCGLLGTEGRWRPVLVALLCLVLGFGACSQHSGQTNVTRITFWHGMGGPLGRVLEDLIKEFNATHPNIHVISVSMGNYNALSQKIMAAVAAGKPPVLAQAYENWTVELIMTNSIVPIQKFIDGPTGLSRESLADILPVFIENNKWGNTIWSFPFNKSVRALYYNKDLFAKAGLDPEHPPETWDDYYEYARRITKDTNGDGKPEIWGTAGQINAWTFGNLLLENGGQFLDPKTDLVAFNGPEGIEALAFMKKLLADGVGFVASGFEYQNDFLAGKVGMIEGSTVSVAFMAGKYSFPLGIAPLPRGKLPGMTIAGTNIVIFSKATPAEQEAAWEFVKWFTDTQQTAKWAAGTYYVPIRRSAFETDVLKQQFDAYPGLRETFGQLDYASFEPKIAGWYAGRRYLDERAIEAALKGDVDEATALNAAAARANSEIKRLKRLQQKLGLSSG